ncbi:MAG: ABC transporter ATP-binding protein [Dorea sp.]|jgi:ATP-binding cassette subfamily B protein|nr:ABC transporter ATP-binding protein [Dorea sp.]
MLKDKKKVVPIILRELNILKEENKKYLFLCMLGSMICSGIKPALLTVIPQIFVSLISTDSIAQENIYSIAVIFATVLIAAVLEILCDHILEMRLVELRRVELQKYQKWYQQIDYCHLEDADFAAKNQSAIDALGGDYGFFGTYMAFIEVGKYLVTALLCGVLLLRFHIGIVCICLLTVFAVGKINASIGKYIEENEKERATLNKQKSYFSELGYDFSYGKDIRIFMLSNLLKKKFAAKSEEYIRNMQGVFRKKMRLGFVNELLICGRNLIICLLLALKYYNGSINLSQVTLYMGMVIALNQALDSASDKRVELIQHTVYSSHYFKLIDDKRYISQRTGKALPQGHIGTIQFSNVSFHYPRSEKLALKNINFQIHPGEKVAFVGINGAGKSTIIKLLTRLFDATAGEVLIDGVNISSIDKELYYKKISVVYQDVNIYAASILQNVTGISENTAGRERAVACLKAMKLDQKIDSLPQRYDTSLLKIIDENGIEISGGQAQKVAIARALYKEADLYIMDEPTSALDALAETEVYELFNHAVKDKTVLFISHRLSSTKFCDRIYLLSPNGIEEVGKHEELMKKKGQYYNMFVTQGQYYRKGNEKNDTRENTDEIHPNRISDL